LIVDEVLAVGDVQFQKKCLGKMSEVAKDGRTVLFVSHNIAVVENICDKAILIEKGIAKASGDISDVLEKYFLTYSDQRLTETTANVVYYRKKDEILLKASECIVKMLEIIDMTGRPVLNIRTWDSIVFRIHYKAVKQVKGIHFLIEFYDMYGHRLVCLHSNTHIKDENLGFNDGYIDCVIDHLPLAAGRYSVGVGSCIPDQRMVAFEKNAGLINVGECDIYQCGRPPVFPNVAFAINHYWKQSNSIGGHSDE